MENEDEEDDKNIYYEQDDGDDDIVIKKKGNNQDDSAQKQQDKNGEGELSNNSSSTQSLPVKNKLSTTTDLTSKVSQKQSLGQQKTNSEQNMFSTPTKQQMKSSNLSSEKIKQNSDSKLLSAMQNENSSEDEFKPISLNTMKQPTPTLLHQDLLSSKIHGLKPTSSTASSASLNHKGHHQQSGSSEKVISKKSLNQSDSPNQKIRKEMITPEKKQNSSSLSKKDVTPDKLGSKIGQGMSHSHQTHGKLNSQSGNLNPTKINRALQQNQTNGSQNILQSQSNLSPMQKDLKLKKGDQTTPQKSSLQNQQKASNQQNTGNSQYYKKPSEGQIKITIGGEQISRISQDVNPLKKKEDGLKNKIKDPLLILNKEGEDSQNVSKISIPAGSTSEQKKTEEQKKLEEQRKRERILKKKEMKLLQIHQQKQAEAAAAAVGNLEGGTSSDPQKIILMKNSSIKGEDGSNYLKFTLDSQKIASTTTSANQDVNFNSRQIYDKIIPPNSNKSKKSSINQEPNSTSINAANPNINYSKIKINVGGSPVVPSQSVSGGSQGNIQNSLNFPIPQISVGGERVDFKFTIEKKSLRKEYENMVKRKQLKYKKLLEVNLTKMQKVTNWMIKEWSKQKKDVRSETLDYFKDILNERQKIKDNLDVRKIQLFLKMFLYRLRDFYSDLKPDYIEKLKTISEKLYKIGSRAIVYKTPLQHRDNQKNASFDMQVSNTQILDESHPLKKLQEEILEIEREMKLFRRMLNRDIQKYQEQSDATVSKTNKKLKTKDDPNSQYGSSEQGQQFNAGQGYDDPKDILQGDRDQQQKQSEIFTFFLEYNKFFEKQTSDLNKIQNFLSVPPETNLIQHLINKYPIKAEQNFDICETFVIDEKNNQIDILDYIKKKRKLSSSEKSLIQMEGAKIEDETENMKFNQDKESVDKQFEQFSIELNFEKNKETKVEGDENNIFQNQQQNLLATKNVFLTFEDDENSNFSEEENKKYNLYKNQKLKNSQNILRICNNGSEFNHQQNSRTTNTQILPDFNISGIKRANQLLTSQFINKKVIYDLYKDKIKRRKITEIKSIKLNKISLLYKKDTFDAFNQQFFMKIMNNKIRYLDDNIANTLGLNGIIDISVQFEIRLEKEFSDQNNKEQEINDVKFHYDKVKQNQDLNLEFQIKNCISNTAHAYYSEIDQITKQLQLNCKENSNIYSNLCPEDVETVIQSFKVENYLEKVLQHNSSSDSDLFSIKEQYDPQSALTIRLINYQKVKAPEPNPSNQTQMHNEDVSSYQIELSLSTPINSLRDLEIRFNKQELFIPMAMLLRSNNRIQQQTHLQQQQQQTQLKQLNQKQLLKI